MGGVACFLCLETSTTNCASRPPRPSVADINSGSLPSLRKNGRNAGLDAHLWVTEGCDPQGGPNGGVVGHVMTGPLGHRFVDTVSEPHVVRVNLDHMFPARTSASQGPLDIAECLGDPVRELVWELPIIV